MADDLAVILDRSLMGAGIMSVHQPIAEQGQVIADIAGVNADKVNAFNPAIAEVTPRSGKAVRMTLKNLGSVVFITKLIFHGKHLRINFLKMDLKTALTG
jgi:hypothetical protein